MKEALDYSLSGVIRDARGRPVARLKVRAYDKDFFRNQLLGDGTTDDNGRYEIRFSQRDFTGPLVAWERHPDVFVRVFGENGTVIYSTENSILVDAGRHTVLDINVPLEVEDDGLKDVTHILGVAVNMKYLPKLSNADVVNAYRLIRYPDLKVQNLETIRKAFPGLLRPRLPGDDCVEGIDAAIRLILKERNADADMEDADDYAAGTTIRSFFTANTVTRYTLDAGNVDQLTGTFATNPAADQNFNFPGGGALIGTVRANLADLQAVNASNTEVAPTYVQQIGLMAEHALSRYIGAVFGFQDPRGAATLFEMRIKAQAAGTLGRTTPAWNYVEVGIQNNDTLRFGTVPHEMFHQVQYRYNPTTTRSGIYGILREGGARLIEDSIFDNPNRYILSAAGTSNTGIFPNPELSLLDQGSVSTALNYAGGIFWKYFAEQHSPNTNPGNEPAIGIETYRILLQESATATAGYTVAAMRNARGRMPWYGTFDQFSYYDAAATELNSNEATYPNFLVANYMHGLIASGDADYDRRFDYLEDDDATAPTVLNTIAVNAEAITIGQSAAVTRNVAGHNPYAARYYVLTPNAMSAPRMLRISYSSTTGMTDPIIQIIRLGAGETLVDVHRSDRTNYSKTISMAGLSRAVVIVASRENGGSYSLQLDEQASASDVMVTRWNSRVGTEYEVDPRGWGWTWVSPDIIVDTNNDGLDDVSVFFAVNNRLKVRLRNRGNQDVNNIQIDFWYQKATPFLSSANWMPVQNLANVTQQLTMQSLAAGTENWFAVDWCPDDDGSHHRHWCVKVLVTVSGDPNADNKMAFRNFANVEEDSDQDLALMFRFRRYRYLENKAVIVPRKKNGALVIDNLKIPPAIKAGLNRDPFASRLTLDAPDDLTFAQLRRAPSELKAWDRRNTGLPADTNAFYPLDRLALPPGINPEDVTTVAHFENGKVIGGVSYRVP